MELEYRVEVQDGRTRYERTFRQGEPRIKVGDVLDLGGAQRVVVRSVEQDPTSALPGVVYAELFTSSGMGV